MLGQRLTGGLGSGNSRPSASHAGYVWLKKRISTIPRDVGMIITEAEMIEGAGVGRTPAREALQRLEVEGHLQIIPRKGIYIAPITDAEMKHLLDSRRAIERWSGEEVVSRGLLTDDTLADILATQERAIEDHTAFIENDRLFHETIVKAAGNPVLANFYQQLQDRQVRMGVSAVSREDGRAAAVLTEHRLIARAVRAADTAAVRAAIDDHLTSTLHALQGRS